MYCTGCRFNELATDRPRDLTKQIESLLGFLTRLLRNKSLKNCE